MTLDEKFWLHSGAFGGYVYGYDYVLEDSNTADYVYPGGLNPQKVK